MATQTYAKHFLSNYEKLLGALLHPVFSVLPENDHPELDISPHCGPDDVAQYESPIGACQWKNSLVHIDLVEPIDPAMGVRWYNSHQKWTRIG